MAVFGRKEVPRRKNAKLQNVPVFYFYFFLHFYLVIDLGNEKLDKFELYRLQKSGSYWKNGEDFLFKISGHTESKQEH